MQTTTRHSLRALAGLVGEDVVREALRQAKAIFPYASSDGAEEGLDEVAQTVIEKHDRYFEGNAAQGIRFAKDTLAEIIRNQLMDVTESTLH